MCLPDQHDPVERIEPRGVIKSVAGKWRAIPNETSNSYIIEITSADR
jgi:hypothetical protein